MAKQKVRGFEVVADWARSVPGVEVRLPQRATRRSAAYDIFSLETKRIMPGEKVEFGVDVKVYMQPDEVLHMYPRSSHGIKLDLMLANTTGVIDSDYYSNPDNDGRINVFLRNLGSEPVLVFQGDKIAQAEFAKYLLADDDDPESLPERVGGVGHSGR